MQGWGWLRSSRRAGFGVAAGKAGLRGVRPGVSTGVVCVIEKHSVVQEHVGRLEETVSM